MALARTAPTAAPRRRRRAAAGYLSTWIKPGPAQVDLGNHREIAGPALTGILEPPGWAGPVLDVPMWRLVPLPQAKRPA